MIGVTISGCYATITIPKQNVKSTLTVNHTRNYSESRFSSCFAHFLS